MQVRRCILQLLYHRLHQSVKTKNCVAINILVSYDFERSLSSSSILNGERNDNQLRPEEILLTLLEQGEADAIPAYKHEAIERGFHFIRLLKEVNLGDAAFENHYKQASRTQQDGSLTLTPNDGKRWIQKYYNTKDDQLIACKCQSLYVW
jgi:hypothetical protein